MGDSDFWQNRELAEEKIKELGEIKDIVDRYSEIEDGVQNLLGRKSFTDQDFYLVRKKFRQFEIEEIFAGPYDKGSAILGVYPGAGGDDAEDWAKMLIEMYIHYSENRGWKVDLLDDNPNRRTIEIKGKYVFGYLKKEAGVHRLVRVSPFSQKKLRHTSFALVEVLPDIPEIDESRITIPEDDLKFEFFRSSGPGGQNVNKVETAVRVVHLPTGISASSQVERSQASNREKATRILKTKLLHLMEKNKAKEVGELKVKVKPEWGNQIRSYVLNPYKLVKDIRTGVETSNIDQVLGGEIDEFIEAEVEKEF